MITIETKNTKSGRRAPGAREGGRVSLVHQHQARCIGAGSSYYWFR